MPFKFYHAENAGREIAGERFEVFDVFGGTAHGVFQTDNPKQQTALDAVVLNPKSAVTEITAAEYQNYLKKKAQDLSSFPVSTQSIRSANLKSPAGVVVEGGQPADLTEQKVLDTVENALATPAGPKTKSKP